MPQEISDTEGLKAQIEALSAQIESSQDVMPQLLFSRGRLYWKAGRRAEAMSDYAAAAAADPDSPAAAALEWCRSIMDFYDHNLYNP